MKKVKKFIQLFQFLFILSLLDSLTEKIRTAVSRAEASESLLAVEQSQQKILEAKSAQAIDEKTKTFQTEIFHLKSENAKLTSQVSAANTQVGDFKSQLEKLTTERDNLLAINHQNQVRFLFYIIRLPLVFIFKDIFYNSK